MPIMSAKNTENILTVGFISLGCPKNQVDSEKMLAQIIQAGLVITEETENCDIAIVNTCGFIAPAKQEALDTIKQLIKAKKKGNIKKIVVVGCLVQRMGEAMLTEIKGIDAIVGLGRRDDIVKVINNTLKDTKKRSYLTHHCDKVADDMDRLLISPSHSAYLRISEGCDHKCSFCTIPAIRGSFRSKPMEQVLAEADQLARAGVAELNIIAQDTAYYGRDINIKNGLAELLKKIEKIKGIEWIRIMYLYPVGINDYLLQTITRSTKILPYFDMPIQHINDDILMAMRRPDRKQYIISLIEKIKDYCHDAVLRTTVIVGFPGETDEQFAELVDFVERIKFDALGCFPYYPEESTPAADLPGQIPDDIKQKRLDEIMMKQQRIAFGKNRQLINTTVTCLVDSIADDIAVGRYYGQALDIDGLCIIKNCRAKQGSFINTKVIDTRGYDLVVEQF